MSDRAALIRAAERLGQFVAAGLIEYAEADAAIMRRAAELTTDAETLAQYESTLAAAISRAATAHELAIAKRIRESIAPLIACRACTAAVLAQARHANNRAGRLNAIPDADVADLVRAELTAAVARLKAQRRA